MSRTVRKMVFSGNSSSRRKRRATQAASLAFVLALTAGCGATEPASDTKAQGVTADTIKIGMFAPYSGDASVYSKAARMAEAMYNDVNSKGGINGRKIQLVTGDSSCDAASVQGLIRKFVEQDKVFMIHGGSCSNAVVAAKPLIEALSVPVLVMNAANPRISDPPLPNLFHPKPTAAEYVAGIVDFIASNKDAKNVSIVAQSDEWGQSWAKPTKAGLPTKNLTIDTVEEIDPKVGDATPAIRKVLNAASDMAAVYAYPQPMTVFLRGANPQGLTIPIVTGDGTRPDEQATRLGNRALAENFFSAYSFTKPFGDPAYDQLRDLFTKAHADLTWDTVAIEGAVGAAYNIELLTRMGDDVTWKNWIAKAETEKIETLVGGPMSFQPFDASSPRTRRPGMTVRFSVLDPTKTGSETVVVETWDEWLKLKNNS